METSEAPQKDDGEKSESIVFRKCQCLHRINNLSDVYFMEKMFCYCLPRNPRQATCQKCRVLMPPISLNKNAMMVENTQMREHLARASIGESNIGAQPSPNPGLGSNGNDNYNAVSGADGSSGFTQQPVAMASAMVQNDQSGMFWMEQHAVTAMNELLRMANEKDSTLWIKAIGGKREILNYEEYMRAFPAVLRIRPGIFVYEATRATAIVQSPPESLIEIFMDEVLRSRSSIYREDGGKCFRT